MKKHYFLGTAAGFTKKMRKTMRKSSGSAQDLIDLYEYLYKEYDGKQVIVTRNGRSAIAAGLDYYLKEFLGQENGEVIINGFTCYAVVQGVTAAGFVPVYADIDQNTLNFTVETLEKVLTDKTKAIIVQNTLGNMVDIVAIEKFCKKHHLLLIEDLAHSAGRFYPDGREAGKVGKVVVFSFGKEKSIDAISGGAVVFRDEKMFLVPVPQEPVSEKEEIRARAYPTIGAIYRGLSYVKLNSVFMRLMLKTGLVKKSADAEVDYEKVGLSNFQAKVALEQLKDKAKLKKKPLREFYLVDDQKLVLQKLKKAGYFFDGFWYEKPVSPERYYRKVHFPEDKCPVAVEVSKRIVNLPSYYNEKDLGPARKIIKEHLWTGQK